MKNPRVQADGVANVEGDHQAPLSVEELAGLLYLKRVERGVSRKEAARLGSISTFKVRERERAIGLETMVDVLRYLAAIGVRVTFRSEPKVVKELPLAPRNGA